jgi:hypothetical protein
MLPHCSDLDIFGYQIPVYVLATIPMCLQNQLFLMICFFCTRTLLHRKYPGSKERHFLRALLWYVRAKVIPISGWSGCLCCEFCPSQSKDDEKRQPRDWHQEQHLSWSSHHTKFHYSHNKLGQGITAIFGDHASIPDCSTITLSGRICSPPIADDDDHGLGSLAQHGVPHTNIDNATAWASNIQLFLLHPNLDQAEFMTKFMQRDYERAGSSIPVLLVLLVWFTKLLAWDALLPCSHWKKFASTLKCANYVSSSQGVMLLFLVAHVNNLTWHFTKIKSPSNGMPPLHLPYHHPVYKHWYSPIFIELPMKVHILWEKYSHIPPTVRTQPIMKRGLFAKMHPTLNTDQRAESFISLRTEQPVPQTYPVTNREWPPM